jgi:ABC-type sugar transport system permease subunit
MIEEEGDVWHLLQNVKQPLVEAAAVDGEDGL